MLLSTITQIPASIPAEGTDVLGNVNGGLMAVAAILVPAILAWVAKHAKAYFLAYVEQAEARNATSSADLWLRRWKEVIVFLGGRVAHNIFPLIAKAIEDRKITKEEVKTIQDAIINEMRALWGDEGIEEFSRALKIPAGALGRWAVQQLLEKFFGKYTVSDRGVLLIQYALVEKPMDECSMPAGVIPIHIEWPEEQRDEQGNVEPEHVTFVKTEEIDPNDPGYAGGG